MKLSDDSYLEYGRPDPHLQALTRDLRTSPTSRSLRKDDLYLSGYGRQWGEGLTYSTGIAYGTGLALGGAYGLLAGVRRGGATYRLFCNSVLNSCSMYGPLLANRFGIITMLYCGFHSLVGLAVKENETPLKPALAGAAAGGLYKLASSWRAKAVYSLSAAVAFAGIAQASKRDII